MQLRKVISIALLGATCLFGLLNTAMAAQTTAKCAPGQELNIDTNRCEPIEHLRFCCGGYRAECNGCG